MDRFWSKVNKTEACWLWLASTNPKGYGRYRVGSGVLTSAHRYSYELTHGPIPEGLQIDHTCYVKSCVNPAHLRAVTNKQNQENRAGPVKGSASGYRGVTWSKSKNKWQVVIGHNEVGS